VTEVDELCTDCVQSSVVVYQNRVSEPLSVCFDPRRCRACPCGTARLVHQVGVVSNGPVLLPNLVCLNVCSFGVNLVLSVTIVGVTTEDSLRRWLR